MNSSKIRLFLLIASILFNFNCDFPGGDEFAETKSVSDKKDAEIFIDQESVECYFLNEACDGTDNNCNGEIDEGCPCMDEGFIYVEGTVRYCGGDFVGICRPGNKVCLNGQWSECKDIKGPEAEICDGKDNDCNGEIDKDCPCKVSDNPICGENDIGECYLGWRYCFNGNWSECYDLIGPQEEVCDNLDNDCNGEIDEYLIQDCSNICGLGTEICDQGEWKDCNAPLGDPEVCDDVDNDCDGQTDENLIHSCDFGCGGGGTEKCEHGKWINCTAKKPEVICKNYTNCKDEAKCFGFSCPAAPAEVCDAADNDCDGKTDEDLTQVCSTACGNGTKVCKNGQWADCSAPKIQEEVCDNKDNDCDGQIDENLTQVCSTVCGGGTKTCSSGAWKNCTAQSPKEESCNNKDDDCDEKVDENLTQVCSTVCGSGTQTCENGQWKVCSALQPQNELCDNKDNDCDGQTDESLNQLCSSTCGNGTEKCVLGKWQDCNAQLPKTCMNYETCKNESVCVVSCPSVPLEVCDNLDNDCDGGVDEDFTDLGQTCYVGIGECENSGPYICSTDQAGIACSVEAKLSQEEVCDNLDNNCDGWTDEDLTQTCSTACGSGTETCLSGAWYYCDAPQPLQEYCDNQDNDCDGQTDEDVADCYPVICVNKTSGFPCFSGKCLFNLSGSSSITVPGADIFNCAETQVDNWATINVVFDYMASAGSCWDFPYLYLSAGENYNFFYFPDCYSSGSATISIGVYPWTIDNLKFELYSGDWGASVKIKEITFN